MKRLSDAERAPPPLSLDELALIRAEALRTAERRIQRVAPRADRARALEANVAPVDRARTAALAAQGRLLLRAI